MAAQNPRQIAARILRKRDEGGEFVETLLDAELRASQMSASDRGLCQELTYGAVRWQRTLDWLIARKSKTPQLSSSPHPTGRRNRRGALQVFLRLGLYQIFWLERIPPHASVNETVELAKRSGFASQSGFVNAVLRGYLREFEATRKLLAELKTSQPALGHSHPDWLYEQWKNRWGPQNAAQLMEWNNKPPKTFARVNTLKVEAAMLFDHWRSEGVEAEPVSRDWLPENLVFELQSFPSLLSLKSFQEGFFYVQDPSTLLAARELDPQPGETILDLCAAPGGKTTFIAALMKNEGHIVATDVSNERLELVQGNCERLGVACVELAFNSKLKTQNSKFDRILLDAPCSNTGVMRRRVDLRWRIKPEELSRLQASQVKLLNNAAPQLKPGGFLVYSTCSLEPEENVEVMKQFLSEHKEFRLETHRELLPFADKVDGAFVAKLQRT